MDQIAIYKGPIVTITNDQMRMLDNLMENKYGINLYQMMENAGRCLAILSKEYCIGKNAKGKKIAVLAGSGGNGGGVITAARRLYNWGAAVSVFLAMPEANFKSVPLTQLHSARKIGIPILAGEYLRQAENFDLILDGIFGYSLKDAPHGLAKSMIEWANSQRAKVLSLDVPSGIELDTGIIHQSTVKAYATLTVALPKSALLSEDSSEFVGKLFLADISVPRALYNELELGFEIPEYFEESDIVQLKGDMSKVKQTNTKRTV